MWVDLFLCLLGAHLFSDFALQTNSSCRNKFENKWRSPYHYLHIIIVIALSWLVSFDIQFWWCALIIGVTHLAFDIWKSYREEKVIWFAIDQILHILVLVGVSLLWNNIHEWLIPFGIPIKYIALVVAILICWKPANIFIKLTLKHYSVNMPEDKTNNGFNAGALIGNIERWLILVFVLLQRYEALGLLIAAKSIIRFGEKETSKTEYVLAGTLMSIFIAVITGLFVSWFWMV